MTEQVAELNQEALPLMTELELDEHRKRYKAVGIAMFAVAAGLAILRIVVNFIMLALDNTDLSELAIDTIANTVFITISQVVICLIIPFVIYMVVQKRSVKGILEDASVKRLKWWIPLISVPLAIGCYLMTIVISMLWMAFIMTTGYVYSGGGGVYPEQFSPLLFLLSIFLTGVLPAVCEEFSMRGNFLKSMRSTHKTAAVVLMSALAFGMFHQNITQVFYTAVFGFLMAFLTIKTGSVLPAVIIHFVNNTTSVYLGHDGQYGWGVADAIDGALASEVGLLALLGILVVGTGLVVGCTYLILKQCKKDGSYTPAKVLYKPSLRESSWLIGALVLCALSTFFTFLFGL